MQVILFGLLLLIVGCNSTEMQAPDPAAPTPGNKGAGGTTGGTGGGKAGGIQPPGI